MKLSITKTYQNHPKPSYKYLKNYIFWAPQCLAAKYSPLPQTHARDHPQPPETVHHGFGIEHRGNARTGSGLHQSRYNQNGGPNLKDLSMWATSTPKKMDKVLKYDEMAVKST